MVHLAHVTGLDHEADLHAVLGADEVVMHGREHEQRGNRREVLVGVAVAQHDEGRALVDRLVDLGAHRGEPVAHRVRTLVEPVEAADGHGGAPARRRVDVHDLREFVVVDHRERQRDLPRVLGARAEQVAFGPERGAERGDHGFTDRVERRVRDLRELLREVVEEQARALRQHGDRGVGSHGAERLGTRSRHRREQDLHLFLGVSEGALATVDRCRRVHDVLALGEVGEADAPLIEPVAPRRGRGEVGLDLVVFDEAPGLGVDEEHAARLQAALAHDAARLDVEHADLAREHDEPVVGDDVATGSQSVAVERGADEGTVGEDDRGRAVPRLHEHRVVLVERAPLGGDLGLVLPRLGDHHHDGVRQAAAGEGQEFDDLVERRRVARARRDDRQDRREVAEHLGLELRLACTHPVAVALDGVDLAVVRDHAERLRERPRREGVRRVPRVHERELRREALVGEVGVERLELQGRDHALVDHRAARQRGEVELEFALGALAQAEGQAVEGDALDEGAGRGRRRRLHEQLLHHRHRGASERAELVGAHRHLAPAEHLETLSGGEAREPALDRAARGGVDRQERVADGVRTGGGQRERR